MDFVDDHHVDEGHHTVCLTSHDVPLLWGRDYYVCLLHFKLCETHITSQFSDLDTEVRKRFLELVHYFRCKCFQWRDVNYLELLVADRPRLFRFVIIPNVLGNLTQDSHESDVGLTGTSWGCDQHRTRLLECDMVDNALNLIQVGC